MLTPYQILILLLEIMTPQQIEDAKGPVVRVQSRILKKPSYRSRDLVSLTMLLVEFNLLPFDKLWIRPLLRLYALEVRGEIVTIENEFAALYEMARLVIDANLAQVKSPFRKGAIFFAARYLGAFHNAKQSTASARCCARVGRRPYWNDRNISQISRLSAIVRGAACRGRRRLCLGLRSRALDALRGLIQSLSRRRQWVCGQKCVQKNPTTPGSSPCGHSRWRGALLQLQL